MHHKLRYKNFITTYCDVFDIISLSLNGFNSTQINFIFFKTSQIIEITTQEPTITPECDADTTIECDDEITNDCDDDTTNECDDDTTTECEDKTTADCDDKTSNECEDETITTTECDDETTEGRNVKIYKIKYLFFTNRL